MAFLKDFKSELTAQTSIVKYIEYQFERELNRAKGFLNTKIEENLYDHNSDYMKMLISVCDDILEKNSRSYLEEKPLPDIAKNADIREPIGEIIEYCLETLECGDHLNMAELKAELDEIKRMNDDEYGTLYDFTEEQLEQIIESAYVINDYNFNATIKEQDEIIKSLKTTIRLVDNFSSSNIFRQSFINIFSIFDAYVFDHLKRFFYAQPGELKKFFVIKDKEKINMTLDEIVCFDSIEDLKIDIVQKQFAGKYLSELVSKLYKYKPNIFVDVKYSILTEMIERRNVHLHNKGFADIKYCTSCNIYKLNVGDYAYIDSEYLFTKVFDTLSQFVANLEKELSI